jgi:hypothetical protein
MPRGDGTGPRGTGPMSGHGAGFCGGYGMPGAANTNIGRFLGMGFGRGGAFRRNGLGGGGHGWRNRYVETGLPGWMRSGQYGGSDNNPDPETVKEGLKAWVENMQAELAIMKKHLDSLDKSAGDAL